MKNVVNNKRAYFDYEILDKEIVGVVLLGSELKPLRNGKVSIKESYVFIDTENNCPIIKNMYISEITNTTYVHEETRDRRLLMKKKDVLKWEKKMKSGGITIVALRGFFDEKNRFKLEIGLAKGKKEYDKRQAEKKRSDIKINNDGY